jgi:uncharacterized membrane protein
METGIENGFHWIMRAVEIGGVAIILAGIALSTGLFIKRLLARGRDRGEAIRRYRSGLGRAILIGLEFLVAADIINTVAIEQTLESLAVLAGIVLIRTFLSFSLEVEIEGRWPWRQAAAEAAAKGAR